MKYLATFLIAGTLMVGCASYRDFGNLEHNARRVSAVADAAIQSVKDDELSPEVRDRRLAYCRWVQATNIELRRLVLRAEFEEWSPGQYRVLNRAFDGAFELLEAYAAYPGEMDASGEFVKRPEGDAFEGRVASLGGLLSN